MTKNDKYFTFILYFLNFHRIAQLTAQQLSQYNNRHTVDIRKHGAG